MNNGEASSGTKKGELEAPIVHDPTRSLRWQAVQRPSPGRAPSPVGRYGVHVGAASPDNPEPVARCIPASPETEGLAVAAQCPLLPPEQETCDDQ